MRMLRGIFSHLVADIAVRNEINICITFHWRAVISEVMCVNSTINIIIVSHCRKQTPLLLAA
jgi:hypothetical protein